MIKVDIKKNHQGVYAVILPIRVTPRASRDELLPYQADDQVIRIKVTAPPEDGKANESVIALLSAHLNIPKRDIEVVSGSQSPYKRVSIKISSAMQTPTDFLKALTMPLHAEEETWFNLLNP